MAPKKFRRARRARHPYVAMRLQPDGAVRPRFQPGPRERALGFVNRDLRHGEGGPWFTHAEACAWAIANLGTIAARRADVNAGTATRLIAPPRPRDKSVADLWEAFTRSKKFLGDAAAGIKGLAPNSRRCYGEYIATLKAEPIWRAPVTALSRDHFMNEERGLYHQLVKRHGRAMANGAMWALASAMSWGLNNGWGKRAGGEVMAHPLHRLGLPSSPPRLRVGSTIEINTLVAASAWTFVHGAPLHAVGDAIATAFFSGQRKGDVLNLVLEAAEGERMRLRQQKTGARVSIPPAAMLLDRIAAARRRRATLGLKVDAFNMVIDEQNGRPYAAGTFRNHFEMVRDMAARGVRDAAATLEAQRQGRNEPVWLVTPCPSLADFTFSDLRDSCVTWLARAGCTLSEIAAITGHSLKSIHTILKHYLDLDEHIADNAIRKLVALCEQEGIAV